jgi:hypothetical protein
MLVPTRAPIPGELAVAQDPQARAARAGAADPLAWREPQEREEQPARVVPLARRERRAARGRRAAAVAAVAAARAAPRAPAVPAARAGLRVLPRMRPRTELFRR